MGVAHRARKRGRMWATPCRLCRIARVVWCVRGCATCPCCSFSRTKCHLPGGAEDPAACHCVTWALGSVASHALVVKRSADCAGRVSCAARAVLTRQLARSGGTACLRAPPCGCTELLSEATPAATVAFSVHRCRCPTGTCRSESSVEVGGGRCLRTDNGPALQHPLRASNHNTAATLRHARSAAMLRWDACTSACSTPWGGY